MTDRSPNSPRPTQPIVAVSPGTAGLPAFAGAGTRTGVSVAEIGLEARHPVGAVRSRAPGRERRPAHALRRRDGLWRDRPAARGAGSFFRFIDLFAGIGGFRRAFESVGGECVYTSERDRHARRTYSANYRCDHEIAGDIRRVSAIDIPGHDLLVAGFPCQPFSIAGVSKKNALNMPHGFRCQAQGTLFFDVARILDEHRPKAFLLENVKNLVNHDKGRTFEIIRTTLVDELGYRVHWKILDAKAWAPQHRERIFIAGFRETNGFSFDDMILPDSRNGPRLRTVLHPEDGSEAEEVPYTRGERARVSAAYTLSDHLWNYLQSYAEKHRAAGNGFGFGLVGPDSVSRTLSARYYKDGSEILVEQEDRNPRRLTPRECARLMGFDEPNDEPFVIPVSDTQAYKQFGNAVAVPCARAVARHMAPWLGAPTDVSADSNRKGYGNAAGCR